MGQVTLSDGSNVSCEDIDSTISIGELYEHVKNPQYTETYRTICIKACQKIGKAAWGILMYLHEIIESKDSDPTLVEAAKNAIKKIDPGRPDFSSNKTLKPESGLLERNRERYLANQNIDSNSKTFPRQTATGVFHTKPEIKNVTITEVQNGDDLSSGTRVFCTCNFCCKTTILSNSIQKINKQIVGKGKIFCTNCLRNEFYCPKRSRNTLMLTFRGLIGYYYHCFHLGTKVNVMQIHEIQSYIDLHVKIGLQNPLFHYDSETYTWFIDFGRVGTEPRRTPVEFVL